MCSTKPCQTKCRRRVRLVSYDFNLVPGWPPRATTHVGFDGGAGRQDDRGHARSPFVSSEVHAVSSGLDDAREAHQHLGDRHRRDRLALPH